MIIDRPLDPLRPKCRKLRRSLRRKDQQRVGCPPPGDEADPPLEGNPATQALGSKRSDTPFMQ